MKETKDRKQIYQWLSQGKKIQVNIDGWTTCSEEGLLRHLLGGSTHSYRVEENIYFGSYKAPKPLSMNVESYGRRMECPYSAVGDLTIAISAESTQSVLDV